MCTCQHRSQPLVTPLNSFYPTTTSNQVSTQIYQTVTQSFATSPSVAGTHFNSIRFLIFSLISSSV